MSPAIENEEKLAAMVRELGKVRKPLRGFRVMRFDAYMSAGVSREDAACLDSRAITTLAVREKIMGELADVNPSLTIDEYHLGVARQGE